MTPLARIDLAFTRRRTECPVIIGRGALDRLVDDLAALPDERRVVISDDRVAALHGAPLVERLTTRGLATELLTFPAGEAHKVRETKAALENELFRLGVGRDGCVIAVGGGVTGDLAGFVAATWQRGIPFVQVPSTLLAMVDAAIGGKTGVDLPLGKNLVGSVHQPRAVYADVALLDTLDDAVFREGFAEIVKAGVIADAALFRRLESSADGLVSREVGVLEEVIATSVAAKARTVQRDEREAGRRAILNFGHTIGHALETVTSYRLGHGEAVAIGMVLEARLAERSIGFPEAHTVRLVALLEAFGLPTRLPAGVEIDALISTTYHDKKARGGRAYYALPRSIGRMPAGDAVTRTVDERTLRELLVDAPRGPAVRDSA